MAHHVAVGALIGPKGVLLAHRRSDLRYYPDCWDFPGGHIEDGETPAMALVRELSEEIGVTALVEGEAGLRILQDAESAEGLVLDLWAIFDWVGSVANHAPEEHDDVRWFDLAAVQSVQLAHPMYRDFIAGLLSPGHR
ncbi:NUDIX hydrolase [Cryobacterium zongtaii]|nr:NUDIX domain-containing protein [Cryobacterium zongtaii]